MPREPPVTSAVRPLSEKRSFITASVLERGGCFMVGQLLSNRALPISDLRRTGDTHDCRPPGTSATAREHRQYRRRAHLFAGGTVQMHAGRGSLQGDAWTAAGRSGA